MTFAEAQRAASAYGEPQLYEEGFDYAPQGLRDVYGYVPVRGGFRQERLRGPILFRRGACPEESSGTFLPPAPGRFPPVIPGVEFRREDPDFRVGEPVDPEDDVVVPRKRTYFPLWIPALVLGIGAAAPAISVARARKLFG